MFENLDIIDNVNTTHKFYKALERKLKQSQIK